MASSGLVISLQLVRPIAIFTHSWPRYATLRVLEDQQVHKVQEDLRVLKVLAVQLEHKVLEDLQVIRVTKQD